VCVGAFVFSLRLFPLSIRGKLIFAGKAGTGFDLNTGRELAERLGKIERDTPPFASVPRAYQRGARWVDPRLVAEVTFTTWTADHLLRHPSFEGLREDKPAKDVKLERPRPAKRS
jgi:bifunctional non-homologous end joining protein LigD